MRWWGAMLAAVLVGASAYLNPEAFGITQFVPSRGGPLPVDKSWGPFFRDAGLKTGKLAVDLHLKRQVDMSWLATDLTSTTVPQVSEPLWLLTGVPFLFVSGSIGASGRRTPFSRSMR